jgi:cell wall-associated NlpC family hydrolase
VTALNKILRSMAASGLALLMVFATVGPAAATTLSDKRAQAAAVQSQLDALDTKASQADEAYNSARALYQSLTAQVATTEKRIAALQKRSDALQADLAARADQIYRSDGSFGVIEALLSARSLEDFNAVINALQAIGQQDADTVAQLKQAQAELQVARGELVAAQADAAKQQAAMSANARAVHQQVDAKAAVLAGLSKDIKSILAQQAAAEAAAAHARYLALLARQRTNAGGGSSSGGSSSGSSNPGGPSGGGNPASSSQGAEAVQWAEKALGRPYVWAASGPGSFDCSGLTMWAYGHAGVSLPHSSRSQINAGARVSRDNLEPGDLVFFGSPIHHVGVYVGGGDFIESPHSGASVRIASLAGRGDYAGACRP